MPKKSKLFESRVVATNVGYFLRDFSISKTRYVPEGRTEIEFADQVILVGDVIFLIQMKNRDAPSEDGGRERAWYRENVWSHAVKQIRDTLTQVEKIPPFANDRGDQTRIPPGLLGLRVFKMVLYQMGEALPSYERSVKHRRDPQAGFVHIFHVDDYDLVLRKLVTLAEVTEYLTYREAVVRKYPCAEQVTEAALLGGFLRYATPTEPVEEHAHFSELLKDELDDFDISKILSVYRDRVYNHFTQGDELEQRTISQVPYIPILEQLVRLPRTALAEFKKRYLWGISKCSGEPQLPSLFGYINPDEGMSNGFVFVPIPKLTSPEEAAQGLHNFTILAKHRLKVDRMLGVSFRRDGKDFLIDWELVIHPWHPDVELDRALATRSPFRELSEGFKPRYRFDGV
jgi:hypothetical protein